MKKFAQTSILLIILVNLLSLSAYPVRAKIPASWTVLGVYEGITPCDNLNRPLPQMSKQAECELMIWNISFYHDETNLEPTIFHLESSYGMSQPNTTGIKGGGIQIIIDGTWTIIQGIPGNPQAIVYQLYPDNEQASAYFLKLDDNLLHVLAPDKKLMVGNGGWSYTLNRTDIPQNQSSQADRAIEQVSASIDEMPTLSVFEGRTPCHDSLTAFTKVSQNADCRKIKWRLTLHRDAITGSPTTYEFKGTEGTREGNWQETQGTKVYPEGIVYQLYLNDSEDHLAFFNVDGNNLFLLDTDLNLMLGNALWSYTLSRVDTELY